jgi:hypothetical protein
MKIETAKNIKIPCRNYSLQGFGYFNFDLLSYLLIINLSYLRRS